MDKVGHELLVCAAEHYADVSDQYDRGTCRFALMHESARIAVSMAEGSLCRMISIQVFNLAFGILLAIDLRRAQKKSHPKVAQG